MAIRIASWGIPKQVKELAFGPCAGVENFNNVEIVFS